MYRNSTSKMLGKLVTRQGEDAINNEEQLLQNAEEAVFSAPQLKPQMKEVLTNILGPSFSKKHSPVDS
jgi:hypothetical protein